MKFETIALNDLDGIKHLQPPGWPDIVPVFEFYVKKDFCYPIKIKLDGKIVGIGTAVIFHKTGWLAHIIVDKDYRNRGIGSAIVNELLRITKSESVETNLLIATELGFPVYKKAGFEIISEYYHFKREKPWNGYAVSPNISNFRNDYYSMIIEMDNNISGEEREILLKEYAHDSLIYLENNILKGFYIPKLGGGLIFADTNHAGLELMKLKYSKADTAVLPSDNFSGISFLKENGFVQTSTIGIRMVLGKNINWKPEKVYSRIAGNLG